MDKPYLLLVEDNQDDVYLTLRTLQRNGFELPVKVVGNSEEALSYLHQSRPLPMAVLVSFRLPGISGTELIKRLRVEERTKTVPALLLTASAGERDHVCGEACRTLADGCLVKPLDYPELAGTLQKLQLMEAAGD